MILWCARSAPLPAGHHRQAGAGQAAGALREERPRHGPAGDRHAGDQGAARGGEGRSAPFLAQDSSVGVFGGQGC